jgi:hypothetical protein
MKFWKILQRSIKLAKMKAETEGEKKAELYAQSYKSQFPNSDIEIRKMYTNLWMNNTKEPLPPLPDGWNRLSSIIFLAYCCVYPQKSIDDYLRAMLEISFTVFQPVRTIHEHLESYIIPWVDQIQEKNDNLLKTAIEFHAGKCCDMIPPRAYSYFKWHIHSRLVSISKLGGFPQINKLPTYWCRWHFESDDIGSWD